jgi:beta-1,4-mannosyl-glycoprotein beta-1,4-N-acetylglucosaminyltransferase
MVYDCFTFFNELDLLEIRLNILNSVVDKFVLVEATLNHQGKPKPLYYNENKERYAMFKDKIIHVIVDKYPDYQGKSSWVLEHHQRNMIMDGLKNCNPNDTILISDLDEIPRPEIVNKYKNSSGIKILRLATYYYYLNCVMISTGTFMWNGTIILHYKDLKEPQYYRELSMTLLGVFHKKMLNRLYWKVQKFRKTTLKGISVKFIDNAGWHFSFLGGVEMIIKKLEAFAHSEYNKEEFKNAKSIEQAIESGKDIFGRGFTHQFVPIDEKFPPYIRENKSKYPKLIRE